MRKTAVFILSFILVFFLYACDSKKEQKAGNSEVLFEKGDKPLDAYIFFVNPEKENFKLYKATVYESDIPENRVKQALNILFAKPPEGFLSPVPAGSEVKSVYMDSNGTCYLNLSEKFKTALPGGTTNEFFAVYSVVNTVMKNFKNINGVRLLVEGYEVETIGGHIKVSGILRP